jgi:hypothetical protein
MKPHVIAIIQDIIFPLMSYSDADEELWDTDPIEYIRQKFDVFDDFSSPVPAAETLLHNVCKTRKGILNQVMAAFLNVSFLRILDCIFVPFLSVCSDKDSKT